MTQRFKKLIWKRAGAGITTLGLCGAMLFTQAAVPNYVWAEGNTEQIAAQQPADPENTASQQSNTANTAGQTIFRLRMIMELK